jgi:carboxyl-terminal processing protease
VKRFFLISACSAAIGQTSPDPMEPAIRTFAEVYAAVQEHAADPLDPAASIYGGAIPGLLRGLDPHSVFLDPDQFQQLKELNNAEQKGFGSIVSVLPGRVIVLQTLPGTPSAKSGLSPGDEIVAVNGIPFVGLEPEQLIQLLSETRRREARIDVRRLNTPRLLSFQLVPATVSTPSVDRAFLLEDRVGYIRISNFENKTGEELAAAISALGGRELRGLVLDLRNNPGGVVESALAATSLFLKPGTKILSIRGRAKKENDVNVPEGGTPFEFPLAILINEKTASAAELMAAALQDHGRAKLVGSRSFGKGLVQSVYPLSQSAGMALTVAFYYSPKGRNIQRPLQDVQLSAETNRGAGGIEPDRTLESSRYTPLRAFLDSSGAITAFTTEWVRKGVPVTPSFIVPPDLVDDFRVWLSARKIQPGIADWSADLNWVRSRLHQEIFNQTLGVEKGDEVEASRDLQVQAAVALLPEQRP